MVLLFFIVPPRKNRAYEPLLVLLLYELEVEPKPLREVEDELYGL
jgi:hypothetical protein